VAGAGTGVFVYQRAHPHLQFATAVVSRGGIRSTISATGTLNAVVTVPVGTQVSGTIQQLFVDFNSPVRKGQLIARIDPATFQAKLNQAQADLESAQAMVPDQEAEVAKAQADLANAEANVVKNRVLKQDARTKRMSRDRLFQGGNLSQEDRDTAQATDDSADADLAAAQAEVGAAQANLEVARAQLVAAEATVRQKQAALAQAQIDLDNTAIQAPVDGIVVARNVDVGQTVAASLQAPTLFLIAQDLTKMQVDTNVDEADIGRTAPGQEVTFTVDAYPEASYRGPVAQIRQAPQMVENVVTYDVVVTVANSDLKLLPGMTANVKILVSQHEDVLLIPTAALRLRQEGTTSGGVGRLQRPDTNGASGQRFPSSAGGTGDNGGELATDGRQPVWVIQGEEPVLGWVQTGLSDGVHTEVVTGLRAGDRVVVGRTGGT
jgi:HlyD family secretion protein